MNMFVFGHDTDRLEDNSMWSKGDADVNTKSDIPSWRAPRR